MPRINILCPYHGIPEDVALPNHSGAGDYAFKGEVLCGDLQGAPYRATLYLEVRGSEAVTVRQTRPPKIENRYFE